MVRLVFVLIRLLPALAGVFAATAAYAQVATGTVTGRTTDTQGASVPGVTVEATNDATGFVRADLTDDTGTYRLGALPVGHYTLTATLPGFQSVTREDVVVNVATRMTLDLTLPVAAVRETVEVTAATPLISTTTSAVGEIVDLTRIQSLPLNGRQFANLAAMSPGVGLGFHSDIAKSAQYAPQIGGGNGRNINYVVDGGDNNDDTVGGLSQLFPLEAIQEFSLVTQRFDAENGRSNGGVLTVVTKSGTNTVQGSAFLLGRDETLNARTFTEQINGVEKQGYSRYQYGGSLGGPLRRDRAHYFGAYESTRQDTSQVVNTRGIFAGDGVYDAPLRQQLATVKLTFQPRPAHYTSVRYGRDYSTQPANAGQQIAFSAWSRTTSSFHSANINHNWMSARGALNETVIQYSSYASDTPLDAAPTIQTPSNFFGGGTAAPQRTEQVKWQLRDDYSFTTGGPGLAHEIRVGLNWVHEPKLYTRTEQGRNTFYILGADAPTAPVIGVFKTGGTLDFNLPLDLFGTYVQDDWRVTNRLTLNLGVRWDYVSGIPLDQSANPNFQLLQAAGRAGRLAAAPLLADFGQTPRGDRDNIQPRLGVAWDVRGNGRDVVRGGWGLYTDFGYTASNWILAALDAQGGGGLSFRAQSATGLVKPDGTPFQVGDPVESIAAQNVIIGGRPVAGEVVSPVLEQPYTRQANIGWSHQIDAGTSMSLDVVRADGRHLNMRVRPNAFLDGRPALTDLGIVPNDINFRAAISRGESLYQAMIVGVRRRMTRGVDLNASYTLAKAVSDLGTAYDEVAQNIIQDVSDPFSPFQDAPAGRTDARHRVTASAIVRVPFAIAVAPVFFFRSALPAHTIDMTDPNGDLNRVDRTALAYRYTGLDDRGTAAFEADGACEFVNCSRRAPFSQLNLRVSRAFRLPNGVQLEALGEVFNLFDARNPFLAVTQAFNNSRGVANPNFMQPSAYAGDLGQPEQRVGQLGLRLTF